MSAQELIVYATIGLAVVYVVRRFTGRAKSRRKRTEPDVPVSRLRRKKR